MANEITKTGILSTTKPGKVVSSGSLSKSQTQTGTLAADFILVATTSWVAMTFGGVTGVPSQMSVKNLDATNYVELALDNASAQIFTKIVAGDFIIFPPKTATMYIRANTASCDCAVTVTMA